MREWDAQRIAHAAGAQLLAKPADTDTPPGPSGVAIDSRSLNSGELFVGLPGRNVDGGSHATEALRKGAWGVLASPAHAQAAAEAATAGNVLALADPLAGLQRLAHAWRTELGDRGAKVIAITGSTGKTSTKDILAAILRGHLRTAATPANLNTEIGLPLAILAAPGDTQCLVLEMAMRAPGQIAQLTAIAEPDVGVIVNVGPAHLELLGSLEAIAAAKAELIAGLGPGATAVVPAGEPLLREHVRDDLRTITFGEDADVSLAGRRAEGGVRILHDSEEIELQPSFGQAHNLRNLLAAVAAARALGVTPAGPLEVQFSAGRGEQLSLAGDVILIDDCYNANPMSTRAAIDHLSETAPGRTVAVIGDMLELGPTAAELHRRLGEHAADRGVEVLVTVGPLAAEMAATFHGETHAVPDAPAAAELVPSLLREGDTVLVKGSRGVGLERVVTALSADSTGGAEHASDAPVAAPGAGPGRR